MDIEVKQITLENFKPYGQLVKVPELSEPTVQNEQITFWKQQASFFIDGKTEIGVLKVRKHEMVFNLLENHFKTPTILICLDGAFIIPVAPPSDNVPKVEEIEAFKVSKGQALVLSDKCWHGTTYPVDKEEITLLVIFKENTFDDDTVNEVIDANCRIVQS